MDKELGKHIPQGEKRKAFLLDNCDSAEIKGYMKQFAPEELTEMKNVLTEVVIEINDIEEEKREAMAEFKDRLKPHLEDKKQLLSNLKNKAEFKEETCYKFIDRENRMVGFYNANGDLIESRPTYAQELQGTIFQMERTGTND